MGLVRISYNGLQIFYATRGNIFVSVLSPHASVMYVPSGVV